jgi:hypothetical protein
VPREQFAYGPTKELLTTLDTAAQRSGVSRGQAFEDFLQMSVCALSGGGMEDEYLQVVQKHSSGKQGHRGCDEIAKLFAQVITVMEETRQDVLGDLFQGAITYGEAGQFLTPDTITRLMADMAIADMSAESRESRRVLDPCCGSGRMLLSVAERQPHWEFIGQDVDLRCVRMTAINLALRNLYGYVIWGNSLGNDQRLVYRTGFNARGFIRTVEPNERPAAVQQAVAEAATEPARDVFSDARLPARGPASQLRLF